MRELQEQKLKDDEMQEVLRQISELTFKSEERLLGAVGTYLNKQSLMVTLGALGFRGAPVSDLATAIEKIRPPAEPEPRLSPREPGMRCPPHI